MPTTRGSRPPWAELPAYLPAPLRAELPRVTAAVIAALAQEVPSYARPLSGAFGEGVRRGVGVALGRFLDLPGSRAPALTAVDREVYVALGRGELRQGRELATLLAAYRVGARVAFRQFSDVARAAGADSDVLVVLAEAVFAYIDELSSASVEGYAQEQSLRAGESGRRRAQLLDLLLSEVVDVAATTEAARRAGWALPAEVRVVVLPAVHADGVAVALGGTALVAEGEERVVAVVPADGSRSVLSRRLAGRHAVVGPVRPWAGAAASRRLALLALGSLPAAEEPQYVEDHLATLILHAVPELAGDLAARRLAPLATLDDATRARLAETLLSWLRHRGERRHIAAELHVHTQTVGYRLGQLRALFGDALEDPDARFELEIALRVSSWTGRTT